MNLEVEPVFVAVCQILEVEYYPEIIEKNFSEFSSWDSLAHLQIILLIEGEIRESLNDNQIASIDSFREVEEILKKEW